MIKFINDALKHRNGEKGFSLVELIVVVAILGILVVIAIPVFGSIQETARKNTVATAAANAATSVSAQVTASGPAAAAAAITALNGQGNDVKYTLAAAPGSATTLERPTGVTGGAWSAPAVTGTPAAATAPAVRAWTTDNVYVFAVNNRGEYAGAGSAAASTQGSATVAP